MGDCSTKATIAAVKDFMYGRAYATLNLEKDQVVKICAAISKDKPEDQDYDYSLIVRKKAQGDDLETPFAAKDSTSESIILFLKPSISSYTFVSR